MMLLQLQEAFPAIPAAWRTGGRFACGVCPAFEGQPPLTGTFDDPPVALRLAGRRLVLRTDAPLSLGMVAEDVIAGQIGGDDFVLTFANAHTVVGVIPPESCLEIGDGDGVVCVESDESWTTLGQGDALALLWSGPLFALGYGHDLAAATRHAQAGLGSMPWQQAEQRLGGLCHVATAPFDDD